ncbi:hypothetical protein ASZ78_003017 [Callipepla squamata]|uniref:Uncharacterized protein n=1 Tax=Callipepla squamata TaxID=9009 RepID=A0A226NGZ9_CALSU|nr:hypothetical protein ASZ78_003017 [Callipepla squamata]
MLLFTNRLVHQDGSLPDITMMNLTASSEKEEDKMLKEAGEKRMEEPDREGGKGRTEKGKEEEEEDEEKEDDDADDESEEEETTDLRNKWHLVIDRLTVLFLKFLEYFHKMQVFVWWLLELHIVKIVSSYIIWVTVKEASKHTLSKS